MILNFVVEKVIIFELNEKFDNEVVNLIDCEKFFDEVRDRE